MDFYRELLESFSRIKGRPLKLLEQEQDPRIPQAITTLQGVNWQQQGSQQVANINGKQARYYAGTGKLMLSNGMGIWDGKNLTSTGNDQKFQALLTAIVGEKGEVRFKGSIGKGQDDGGGEVTGGQVEPVVDGDTVAANVESETAKADILSSFASIRSFASQAWLKLLGKATDKAEPWFTSMFVGRRAESLEARLANSNKHLVYNEKYGGWVFEEGTLDDRQVAGCAETIEDMLKSVAIGECPTDDDGFHNHIHKTGRGEIVISPKGDHPGLHSALVFSDGRDHLKRAVEAAFEACGKELQDIKILQQAEAGKGQNHAIGTGFEDFQVVAAMAAKIKMLKDQGLPVPDHLLNQFALQSDNLEIKLSKLEKSVRDAFLAKEVAGVSVEDAELIGDMYELLVSRDDLFMRMLQHSISIAKDRNPDFVTRAGQEVYHGNRQDTREFHSTAEKMQQVLEDAGVDGGDYEVATLSQLVAEGKMTEDDAKSAVDSGLVGDQDSPVYFNKTSMKAYKNLNHVTLGDGTEQSYNDFMAADVNDPERADLIDTILDDVDAGDDPAERDKAWAEMQKYSNGLNTMAEAVDNVPWKSSYMIRGDKVKAETGKAFVDALEKELREHSDYSELTDGQRKSLYRRAEQLRKELGKDYKAVALFERIKKESSTMLMHNQVKKDLESGDPKRELAARRWLAAKAYHAGGSNDRKLIETAIGYQDGEDAVYRRNDILREAVMGKNGWGVNMEASNFDTGVVVYERDAGERVTMNTSTVGAGQKGKKKHLVSNKTSLGITGKAMKKGDKRKKRSRQTNLNNQTTLEVFTALHEVFSVLRKKMNVI